MLLLAHKLGKLARCQTEMVAAGTGIKGVLALYVWEVFVYIQLR